jgi:hypothetical protein
MCFFLLRAVACFPKYRLTETQTTPDGVGRGTVAVLGTALREILKARRFGER